MRRAPLGIEGEKKEYQKDWRRLRDIALAIDSSLAAARHSRNLMAAELAGPHSGPIPVRLSSHPVPAAYVTQHARRQRCCCHCRNPGPGWHERAADPRVRCRRAAAPGRSSSKRRLKTSDNGDCDADRTLRPIDDSDRSGGEIAFPWASVVVRRDPHIFRRRATTGPNRRRISRATGFSCTRNRDGVEAGCRQKIIRHRRQSGVLGSTRVSGPGQNASATATADASTGRSPRGAEIADMGRIRGFEGGRPALAWTAGSIAAGLVASAPRP